MIEPRLTWRSEFDDCLRRLRLHEKEANRLRDENYELKEQTLALKRIIAATSKGARVCGAFIMTGSACQDCPTPENCLLLRNQFLKGKE